MKRLTKNKEIKLIKFAEELSWLLDSHKDVSLKDLCSYILQLKDSSNHGLKTNTAYLVGVLPNLFQDKELFFNTSEIIDFANNILRLHITQNGNRSRMEYIGMIVCEVSNQNTDELDVLVEALDSIVGNETQMSQVKQSRKMPDFSWNKVIADLTNLRK